MHQPGPAVSAERFVRVVPDVSGIDKEFDYLVPEQLRDQVRVGTLVRVPLHGRRVGGWVVELLEPADAAIAAERLKPIAKVTGHGPSSEIVELARWAAHRWCGPLRAVLSSASPPRALRRLPPSRSRPPDPGVPMPTAGVELIRCPPAGTVMPILERVRRSGPVLVVAPGVERAALAAQRLRASGATVAVLPDDWASAAGGVDVVVGARSAVWATMPNVAAIVVLDEHDEALQEERSPTWHARDVAVERARRLGVPCVLVSPVPSLAAREVATTINDPARVDEREGWPRVEIVDLGDDDPWVTSLATSELIRELRDDRRRVVCVHNVTGRARRLACRACRELSTCEHCATPVAELEPDVLECPRCRARRPKLCQACGAARLVSLRPGISRLREELEAAAGRRVVEVTGATPAEALDADVYIGTEAVLHRVRRVDTVAFLDLDGELLAPRYRAGEQVLALAARSARLVGGRRRGGLLIVQTYLPHHPVIEALRHADPDLAVEELAGPRRLTGFPPYGALAAVSGSGAGEFAVALRADPAYTDVSVLGPADDRYLVRAATPDRLADALASVPRAPDWRLRLHLDPPRL